MPTSDAVTAIKRMIRHTINGAVIRGEITPEESLAILTTIIATYVAQIEDDALRLAHIKVVEENFGAFVEYRRGGSEWPLAMAKAATKTRQ